jgi:hypothetical protein
MVFHTEQWAIRLTLDVGIEKKEKLQEDGVKTVPVFSDSPAAM